MTCNITNCNICYWSDRKLKALESADFGLLAQLIEDLLDYQCDISEDLSYYKAILDGSWPHAVEHLERALKEIKGKKQ